MGLALLGLGVVRVEAQHRVARGQSVVPVEDPVPRRVRRPAEGNQRGQVGRQPRPLVRVDEQLLLRQSRVKRELRAQQVSKIEPHDDP